MSASLIIALVSLLFAPLAEAGYVSTSGYYTHPPHRPLTLVGYICAIAIPLLFVIICLISCFFIRRRRMARNRDFASQQAQQGALYNPYLMNPQVMQQQQYQPQMPLQQPQMNNVHVPYPSASYAPGAAPYTAPPAPYFVHGEKV